MRASEIMITEMAFPKAVLEAKIRSKEETINLHAIKLLAFAVDDTTMQFWRKEILAETAVLAGYQLRGSKGVRRLTEAEYLKMLYVEPFEQNEIPYVNGLIKMAARKAERDGRPLRRNVRTPEAIAAIVKEMHQTLSNDLSKGLDGEEVIGQLATQVS